MEDKNIEIDKDLDISMIIIIVICSVVGSLTVTGLICVYYRHRPSPCSIMPEIVEEEPIQPPKNVKIKRASSERPRDLIVERPLKQAAKPSDKIVRTPRNAKLTKNAIASIARLRRVQKRTSKKAPCPPHIAHPHIAYSGESKQPPPPPIPPRSHLKAMKAAKKLLKQSTEPATELATEPITEPTNKVKLAKKPAVYLL
jgi:Fe-S-cluster containining protein